jgi:enoyl reductase
MMVPPNNDPHGWTYVQVPTWFWVPGSQWRPVSATASVTSGPFTVSATTTAKPSSVVFSPGDGSLGTGSVSCAGPGVAFDDGRAMSQQGHPCNTYTYRNSSSLSPNASATWPAAMTIVWHVAWVGSDGTGGTLPDLNTTTPIALSVGEVEALLTPNPQGGP